MTQVMTCCMVGAKPLPEQMLTISLPDPYFHAIQNKKNIKYGY